MPVAPHNGHRKSLYRLVIAAILIAAMLVDTSITSVGGIGSSHAQRATGPAATEELIIPLPQPLSPDIISHPWGDLVTLPGYVSAVQPGIPQLPVTTLNVLLPADAVPESITISLANGTWHPLSGAYNVLPASPLASGNGGNLLHWGNVSSDSLQDGRLISIYHADSFWPAEPVSLISVGNQRGWQILTLDYWPLAYNPTQGTLRQIQDATVRITFQRTGESPLLDTKQDAFWPTLETSLLNAHDRYAFYDRISSQSPELQSPNDLAGSTLTDYVIITTNAIVANSTQLDAFVQSKQRAGYRVQIVTEGSSATDTTYIGGHSADSRADNIRNWLVARYAPQGIRYVLLIGDPHPTSFHSATSVPMKMTYPLLGYAHAEAPTDMYLSDLSSNWDPNGNGYFGEIGEVGTGGIDRLAEVYVGRVPFYGAYADLDHILYKFIAYQSATGDLSWRNRVLVNSAISNHGPQDNINDGIADFGAQQRTYGDDWGQALAYLAQENGIQPYTLYEKEGVYANGSAYPLTASNAPLNTTNLINKWNEGYGFVTWWGHGSSTGVYRRIWVHDSTRADQMPQHSQETSSPVLLSSSQVSQLDNARPAFVAQASCNNGYPEESNNLGYALLLNGAVGTISASRVSWYILGSWSYEGAPGIADNASVGYRVLERMSTHGETIGEALAYFRGYAALHDLGGLWMNALTFNLYGDPSLGLASPEVSCTVPANVTLQSPQNGLALSGDQVTQLSWMAVSDATGYQIQLAHDADLRTVRVDEQISDTVLQLSLLPADTYYWRVRGKNNAGGCDAVGAWSVTSSFEIKPLDLPFSIHVPLATRQ